MEISELSFLVAVGNSREALIIRDVLGSLNVKDITIAESGLEALKRVQRNPDYFILADWNLPQLSGLKLLREIRSNKKSVATPCVLIISDQDPKDLEQAKALNVTGFIKQPTSPKTFLNELLSVLGKKEELLTPETLMNKADELLESGQAEQALAQYQQAVRTGRTHLADLHADMGLILKDQGHIEEAIGSFEQAVEADPESARSYSALGNAYFSAGRLKEAISALKQALELDPLNHEAKVTLADTYLQGEANNQAEKIYEEVLQHAPDDIHVLNRLGIAYRKQRKYKQALTHYQNALKIAKQDENLYFNLGRCYYEMGEVKKAQALIQQALAINPNFNEASELMVKLKSSDS